jgi:peptide/nickel transport system permease protein
MPSNEAATDAATLEAVASGPIDRGHPVRQASRSVGFRLGQAVLTLLIASFITFALLQLSPGDPVSIILGDRAGDQQAAGRIRDAYYLNHSSLAQYWHWLSGALTGDLGVSYVYHQNVTTMVASRAATTLSLVAFASVLGVVFGILVGLIAALSKRVVDGGISVLLAISIATPPFVVAIVLITIFSLDLNWFPVFGVGSGFVDRFHHLVLPAITLAIISGAALARVTRAAIIEEGQREHVMCAVSRGLTSREVLGRHVFRNALIPIVTTAGVIVAGMVGGTVIVEEAYGLNGIGSLLVLAIGHKDYPVVLSITLIMIAVFLFVNAIVDVLYLVIDPRTRAGGAT